MKNRGSQYQERQTAADCRLDNETEAPTVASGDAEMQDIKTRCCADVADTCEEDEHPSLLQMAMELEHALTTEHCLPCAADYSSPAGSIGPESCQFHGHCPAGTVVTRISNSSAVPPSTAGDDDDPCTGGAVVLTDGETISLFAPALQDSASCEWLVQCPGGGIELNIARLNLEEGWDWVRLYDGPDDDAEQLAELTGNVGDTPVQSASGDSMLVRLTTDGNILAGDPSGFAASVQCAQSGGSGGFTAGSLRVVGNSAERYNGLYTRFEEWNSHPAYHNENRSAYLFVLEEGRWAFDDRAPEDGITSKRQYSSEPPTGGQTTAFVAGAYPSPGVYTLTDPSNVITVDIVACEPCLPGSYDHDGQPETECQLCPPGRFGPFARATSCDGHCAAGSHSPTGSASPDDCLACQEGQYDHDSSAHTPCLRCPAGRYGGGLQCGGACAAGTSSAAGASSPAQCLECGPGTYAPEEASPVCESCHIGYFVSATGAQECTQCDRDGHRVSTAARGTTSHDLCMPSTCSDSEATNYNADATQQMLEDCTYECSECAGAPCCLTFDPDLGTAGSWPEPPRGLRVAEVGNVGQLVDEERLSSVTLSQCQAQPNLPACGGQSPVVDGELVRLPRTKDDVQAAFRDLCTGSGDVSGECSSVWDRAMYAVLGTVQEVYAVDRLRRTVTIQATGGFDSTWEFPWSCLHRVAEPESGGPEIELGAGCSWDASSGSLSSTPGIDRGVLADAGWFYFEEEISIRGVYGVEFTANAPLHTSTIGLIDERRLESLRAQPGSTASYWDYAINVNSAAHIHEIHCSEDASACDYTTRLFPIEDRLLPAGTYRISVNASGAIEYAKAYNGDDAAVSVGSAKPPDPAVVYLVAGRIWDTGTSIVDLKLLRHEQGSKEDDAWITVGEHRSGGEWTVQGRTNGGPAAEIYTPSRVRPVAQDGLAHSPGSMTNGALLEVWEDIGPGVYVSDLIEHARYPDLPNRQMVLGSFLEVTQSSVTESNTGLRIRAFFRPPQSGDYTFVIASDDNSRLSIGDVHGESLVEIASVNDHGDPWDDAGRRLDGFTMPRQWDRYPSQESAPIALDSRLDYVLDVFQKHGRSGCSSDRAMVDGGSFRGCSTNCSACRSEWTQAHQGAAGQCASQCQIACASDCRDSPSGEECQVQAPFDGCTPACAQCRSQHGSSCGSICQSRCSVECNQPVVQPLGGHVAVGATFPDGEEHRPIEIEHLFLDASTVLAAGALSYPEVLANASFTQYADSGCRNRDDICDASRKPCSDAASRLACEELCSESSECTSFAFGPGSACALSTTCTPESDFEVVDRQGMLELQGAWSARTPSLLGRNTFVKPHLPPYRGCYVACGSTSSPRAAPSPPGPPPSRRDCGAEPQLAVDFLGALEDDLPKHSPVTLHGRAALVAEGGVSFAGSAQDYVTITSPGNYAADATFTLSCEWPVVPVLPKTS